MFTFVSNSSQLHSGPQPGFMVWTSKIHRGQGFCFDISSKQIFLGTKEIPGALFPHAPHGCGPDSTNHADRNLCYMKLHEADRWFKN